MNARSRQILGWVLVLVALALVIALRPLERLGGGGGGAPPPSKRSLGVYLKRRAQGGLTIAEVFTGSAAQRARLKAGDAIVAVQGQTIGANAGLVGECVQALLPGEPLRLTVLSEGAAEPRLVEVRFDGVRYELSLARRLIGEGVAHLVSARRVDGLWPHYQDSERSSVAVTALVAYALERAGADAGPAHQGLRAEVKRLLLARRAADGGLDDPGNPVRHRVYATSLLLLACGDEADAALRAELSRWLTKAQVQEAHGIGPVDWHYGGWTYHDDVGRERLRTDLSTARFALQALAHAELPPEDAAWRRAGLFLDLIQNHGLLTTEDDPQHAREVQLRDGGFSFTPRMSKAGMVPLGEVALVGRSYGSATADGLLGLLCVRGVDRRSLTPSDLPPDDRLRAALEWLALRFDLDVVPGFGKDPVGWGSGMRLYYLVALAEALHRAGVWELRDADGRDHAWADEVVRRLAELHGRSGRRFVGESVLMHEDRPTLAAALSIVALAAARDRLVLGGGARVIPDPRRSPQPLFTQEPKPQGAQAVQRGLAIFQARGCGTCHVDREAASGPSLVGVADAYLGLLGSEARARERLRIHLRSPRPGQGLLGGHYPTHQMPPFDGDERALGDLITFLLSRSARRPVSEAR